MANDKTEIAIINEWRKNIDKHTAECDLDREEINKWKTQEQTKQEQSAKNRRSGIIAVSLATSVVVVSLLAFISCIVLLSADPQDAKVIIHAFAKVLQSLL